MENIGLSKNVDKFNGLCTSNTYSSYPFIPYKFPQVCPGQPISASEYSASSWDLLFNNPFTLEITALPKAGETHRLEKAQPWDSTSVKTEYNQPDNCIMYFKIIFKHVFCCYGNSR